MESKKVKAILISADDFYNEISLEKEALKPTIHRALRPSRKFQNRYQTIDMSSTVIETRTYNFSYEKDGVYFYEEDFEKKIRKFNKTEECPPPLGKVVYVFILEDFLHYRSFMLPVYATIDFAPKYKVEPPKKGWVWQNMGGYQVEPEYFPLWCEATDFPAIEANTDNWQNEAKDRIKKDQNREYELELKDILSRAEFLKERLSAK